MSGDIQKLFQEQKALILEDKKRLGLLQGSESRSHQSDLNDKQRSPSCDNNQTENNNDVQSNENKENLVDDNSNHSVLTSYKNYRNLPLTERLNLLNCNEASLEDKKQIFIERIVNSEGPFSHRSDDTSCGSTPSSHAMLRYGEFSPNNPQLRVTAAPYLGLGEYEQRRNLYLQRQKADYLAHLAKIQYDIRVQDSPEKDLSPTQFEFGSRRGHNFTPRLDQRLTSAQNALLNVDMDKPKSILSNRRSGSPRSRYTSEYSSYTPSFMDGFSYSDPTEEFERERLKRDSYQRELRLQIEEKRRLQNMREDQERRERELENKRLEQQVLRMQEEQAIDEQRRSRRDEQMRRHSEDLLRRKHEMQSRTNWRKHTESESSLTGCLRNSTETSSKSLAHYSPPVSRRNPYSFNVPSSSVFHDPASRYNPSRYESSSNRYENSYHRRDALNRMDSLNMYDTIPGRHRTFSRFDSLSRIDSLNQRLESLTVRDTLSDTQRRHSATQQDLSVYRKSPRLRRRSSSSRFEDSLPVPVLKAHSPVARELKHSVPFSSRSSEALRKLEDRWQVPAVQKNIVNPSGGILTQLGAIRKQLQQEQLRMDETLRRRGITQPKAVDFH